MPEYAQFSIQFLTTLYALHQIIHTQILVVLGDNLYSTIVEEYKILNIVQQSFFPKQTVYQCLYRESMLCYLFSVQFFLFIIYA